MEHKKQSSVEWLLDRIEDVDSAKIWEDIKQQAKAMHKQEVEMAHEIGYINGGNTKKVNGEQYYNETFNK